MRSMEREFFLITLTVLLFRMCLRRAGLKLYVLGPIFYYSEVGHFKTGDFCLRSVSSIYYDKPMLPIAAFMAVVMMVIRKKIEESGGIFLLQMLYRGGNWFCNYFNINILQFFYIHGTRNGTVFANCCNNFYLPVKFWYK